jgi:hypothetical protein
MNSTVLFSEEISLEIILDNGNILEIGGTAVFEDYTEDSTGYRKVSIHDLSGVWADEYDNDGELVFQHDAESYSDEILDSL